MLLNLSNHPHQKWLPLQKTTAEHRYDEVKDLPFPSVPATADAAELDQLVADYFQQIQQLEPAAVHVMGEMTFTYRLVKQLEAAGLPCIASTTERLVEERDGKKIVQFKFIRFRPYF